MLSILAAATAIAAPAGAQFAGGRSAFDDRARPELVQFNDFFRPFWGNEPQYRNRDPVRARPAHQRRRRTGRPAACMPSRAPTNCAVAEILDRSAPA